MRFYVFFIIGHFIAPCSEMYGSEICTTCPHGHAQPDFISSLDNERDCFLKKGECTAYGKILYLHLFKKNHKCNLEWNIL